MIIKCYYHWELGINNPINNYQKGTKLFTLEALSK